MDFNVGLVDVFVATMLVCFTILMLAYVSSGFVATFLTLILLSLCSDKVYECCDIY